MKRITKIFNCLNMSIKKYIFNIEIDTQSVDCKQLFFIQENERNSEELLRENEYFDNYKITTRWQTL
jgi:hypothetical protein